MPLVMLPIILVSGIDLKNNALLRNGRGKVARFGSMIPNPSPWAAWHRWQSIMYAFFGEYPR